MCEYPEDDPVLSLITQTHDNGEANRTVPDVVSLFGDCTYSPRCPGYDMGVPFFEPPSRNSLRRREMAAAGPVRKRNKKYGLHYKLRIQPMFSKITLVALEFLYQIVYYLHLHCTIVVDVLQEELVG